MRSAGVVLEIAPFEPSKESTGWRSRQHEAAAEASNRPGARGSSPVWCPVGVEGFHRGSPDALMARSATASSTLIVVTYPRSNGAVRNLGINIRTASFHDHCGQNTVSTGWGHGDARGSVKAAPDPRAEKSTSLNQNRPVVVFSSFDEVLDDSDRSPSDAVAGVLRHLTDEEIPLVFHSSKTRAQLESIYQTIGLRHPFIAENGGAVFIPRDYFGLEIPNARHVSGFSALECGRPYAHVVEALHYVAQRLGIKIVGFSDMSIEEVAIDCGLSLLQARLAKLREYDEPFRIPAAPAGARQQLVRALRAANFGCSTHGRYQHVGAAVEPAMAVNLLCVLFRRTGGLPLTIGIGDNMNDAGWLHRMDIPLIVSGANASNNHRLLREVPKAKLTAANGVRGWADSLVATLDAVRQQRDFDASVGLSARQSSH